MRILIAEDDLSGRIVLSRFLSSYGECDMTIDGIETVEAFMIAHHTKRPYDLICLDIMMPRVDGIKALKAIRKFEEKKGIEGRDRVKVIMATALDRSEIGYDSMDAVCEAYVGKPIETDDLIKAMGKIGLI